MHTSRSVTWVILGGLALALIALAHVLTGDVAANGALGAPPGQPALLQGRPTLTPSPIAKPKPRKATPTPTEPPTPVPPPTAEVPAAPATTAPAPTAAVRPERLPATAEPAVVAPLALLAIAAATVLLAGYVLTRRQ
jgi:hypothetical protein